ncbi:hypothetical protein BYT27DRAFT_7255650 [Phlegmacium glaucopus]|nr:hypothetical protein BYT27DRAFT_7255650 [Phlegmacium glaucopus]
MPASCRTPIKGNIKADPIFTARTCDKNSEKAVLISVDYSKASEAPITWDLGKGDDLGDIISASTSSLNHSSSALSQHAAHGHSMRDQLKAIRTREESLDELKRRQHAVIWKAEDAEKRLNKMNPEHKNLAMHHRLLIVFGMIFGQ